MQGTKLILYSLLSLVLGSSFTPMPKGPAYVHFQTIKFNSDDKISPGRLSPDGLRFYTAVEKGRYDEMSDSQLPDDEQSLIVFSRPDLNHKFKESELLDIEQDMSLRYHQPTLNSLGNVIVFAASKYNRWEYNQLYIAERYEYKPIFTEVRALDEINDSSYSDAYPFLSHDGLRLYYLKGERHYVCNRTGYEEKFGTPKPLVSVNNVLDELNWGNQSTLWVNMRGDIGILLVNTTLYKFDIMLDGTSGAITKFMDLPDGINYFNSSISFTQDLSQFAVYCTYSTIGSGSSVYLFKRK